MDIGKVAKISGLPASTLRFYEEKGLIRASGRNGLRRVYHSSVIERLALISLGQNAGFSLEEIGEMFTSEGPTINRSQLLTKADELDKKIEDLIAMREGLRHAAACKFPNQLDCPKFLRILRIAGKNRSRQSNILKR
ncbi:helix-turn-helix domain-containing protein [Shewanella sp. D64]|uniref:helix-turn-helix domain-containing protein n=1 Tax=unclassified Shewanella TaxID=196818 RepID=UPI0022BA3AC8|nr:MULTISPECIES: helix-turn-helix domain-containing protein [unclassified Shewanella]MEC4727714.1 helix-turn-helix domain-containing protein [Shewanella sp. D64]MEC4739713.1 helix-turn-helix domain-containing protein [Shewanella sp. E94]WBJ94107.1 helix-turn-helix domain-containing protein [Shewanella sp. MTB7]